MVETFAVLRLGQAGAWGCWRLSRLARRCEPQPCAHRPLAWRTRRDIADRRLASARPHTRRHAARAVAESPDLVWAILCAGEDNEVRVMSANLVVVPHEHSKRMGYCCGQMVAVHRRLRHHGFEADLTARPTKDHVAAAQC